MYGVTGMDGFNECMMLLSVECQNCLVTTARIGDLDVDLDIPPTRVPMTLFLAPAPF